MINNNEFTLNFEEVRPGLRMDSRSRDEYTTGTGLLSRRELRAGWEQFRVGELVPNPAVSVAEAGTAPRP
jgi:hypothetical protein